MILLYTELRNLSGVLKRDNLHYTGWHRETRNFESSSGSPQELVEKWEWNPFVHNHMTFSNHGPVDLFTTCICRQDILQERWWSDYCSQRISTSLQCRTSWLRFIVPRNQGMGWEFCGDEFSYKKNPPGGQLTQRTSENDETVWASIRKSP